MCRSVSSLIPLLVSNLLLTLSVCVGMVSEVMIDGTARGKARRASCFADGRDGMEWPCDASLQPHAQKLHRARLFRLTGRETLTDATHTRPEIINNKTISTCDKINHKRYRISF